MSRYNTGNPLDSSDARDLDDNSKNLDQYANSEAETFTNRFGVAKKTVAAIERSLDGVFNEAELSAANAAQSAANAAASAGSAENSANIATASANFVGLWSNQTGAANVPYSVYHNGNNWQLLNNLADVTASEPSASNSDWAIIVSSYEPKPVVDMPLNINNPISALSGGLTTSRNSSSTIINNSGVAEEIGIDEAQLGIDGLGSFDSYINYALWSQDFSNPVWLTLGAPTLTHNQIDPSGGSAATKIQTTSVAGVYQNNVFPSGGDLTVSLWLKGEVGGEQVLLGTNDRQSVTLTQSWQVYTVNISGAASGELISCYSNVAGNQAFYISFAVGVVGKLYNPPYIKTESSVVSRASDISVISTSGNMPIAGSPFSISCDCLIPISGILSTVWHIPTGDNLVTLIFRRLTNSNVQFSFSDADGTDRIVNVPGIDDTRHRFTCLYDGLGVIKVYSDGVLVGLTSGGGAKKYSTSGNVYIGASNASGQSLNSSIKNFKIYHRALTDSEIATLGGAD